MKNRNILITGTTSYIGNRLRSWLEKSEFEVNSISLRDRGWRNEDFSKYGTVFHAVGMRGDKCWEINSGLAFETVKKAVDDGVSNFIYMSSMAVYGRSEFIDADTAPEPCSNYGKSKLEGEERIRTFDSKIKISFVRAPMVYGKGSGGNYERLSKMIRLVPVFPKINNKRSMIYIDNLCELIRLIIENGDSGVFFPQNREYVNTLDMVRSIAEANNKKILELKCFNFFLRYFKKRSDILNKLFGNMVYEKSMSIYKKEYRVFDFKESIRLTEKHGF